MLIDMIVFSLTCIALAGVFVGLITLVQNKKLKPGMVHRQQSVIKVFETTLGRNNADRKN
jgi:hypothetical protein